MRDKFWNSAKKITAFLAVFCCIYTVIFLLRAIMFGTEGGSTYLLGGLAIIFAGYIIAGLLTRKKQNKLRLLISYLLSLVPAVIMIYIHKNIPALYNLSYNIDMPFNIQYTTARAIFEGTAAFILYFTGAKTRVLDFDSMLSNKTIITAAVIFIGSLILLHFYKEIAYLKNWLYNFCFVFVAMTFLVKNQQNLDRAFIKKHIDQSTVPKDLRRYNFMLVLIVLLVIIALFNIQSIIDFIAMVLENAAKYAVLAFLYVMYFLSQFIPGAEGGGEKDERAAGIPTPPGGETSKIANLILTIIFGIMLLIVVIYIISKLPKLIRTITEKLKKIYRIAASHIRKLFGIEKEIAESEEDYIDEIEIIKPADKEKLTEDQGGIFKKIGRMLGTNLTLTEKVRRTYAAVLQCVKSRGISISVADTARDIYNKLPDNENLNEVMSYVTEVYEKVRYGGKTPKVEEFENYKNKARQAVDILKSKT